MIRQMIKIDEALCNGCGLCVSTCHEGAIRLVEGKAKLVRDDYCDGLGNCLPVCPTGAIRFETREAAAFDKAAVEAQRQQAQAQEKVSAAQAPLIQSPGLGGCPGSMARRFERQPAPSLPSAPTASAASPEESALAQWPLQIKLVPINAAYFKGAKLLVAADCSAFAYAQFHRDFLKDHICLIGCPKLDEGDYADKLSEILKQNEIKSVSLVRMEVPCCGGLEYALKNALSRCGKIIPWRVSVISTEGRLLESY